MAGKRIEKAGYVERMLAMYSRAENDIKRVEAKMNARIESVKSKAMREAEQSLINRESSRAALEAWWLANKPTGEDAAKSQGFLYGRIGMRTGKPYVHLVTDVEFVVNELKRKDETRQYVTQADPVVDEDRVLLDNFTLPGFLSIKTSPDAFFVDLEAETVRPRRKKAAA